MKSIVEQAKAEVKAKQNKTPWYIKLFVGGLDALSFVAIIALAVIGAQGLIDQGMTKEVSLGIALVVVGLFSSRLIDRVYTRR